MKLQVCLVLVILGAFAVNALKEEDTRREDVRHRESDVRRKEESSDSLRRKEDVHKKDERQRERYHDSRKKQQDISSFRLSEEAKEKLVKEKSQSVFHEKIIEYFLKNPVNKEDRECFSRNLKSGYSIDFVIDIASSPSLDRTDKFLAENPIALYLEKTFRSASRVYFDSIRNFIETVTVDMKSDLTYCVLVDNGRKFYIRGRDFEDVESVDRMKSTGEFTDVSRNLKTLWPVGTKEVLTKMRPLVKNNLGHLTELTLWSRDNGVPIVLKSNRHSKPIYTIVITDGSSNTKLDNLTDDVSRTTVIDIGHRRFANKLSWDEMRRCAGVYTLNAPQQLPLMADTIRNMACQFGENSEHIKTM